MEADKNRYDYVGEPSSHLTNRPPPGLSRNPNFQQNINSQVSSRSTVSPPPGLGHSPFPYAVNLHNNNGLYHQHQQANTLPGYPYYSPSQTPPFSPSQQNFQNVDVGMMSYQSPVYQDTSSMIGQMHSYHGLPISRKSSLDDSCAYETSSECTQAVIEPMIENLVGSMGMSNGTYSHFGPPSIPTTVSAALGHATTQASYENNVIGGKPTSMGGRVEVQHPIIDPFNSTLESQFQQKMELKIRQKQLLLQQQQQSKGMAGSSNSGSHLNMNMAPTSHKNTEKGQPKGKPATPSSSVSASKDSSLESMSRPQTPGVSKYKI